MKRIITSLLVACLFTLTSAQQPPLTGDYVLVHTQKSSKDGQPLYYVYNNQKQGGFVITSADDRTNTMLGQSENGTFEQALAIPGFRAWLDDLQVALQNLSEPEVAATRAYIPTADIPDQIVSDADNTISLTIPGRQYLNDTTLPASVEPLLKEINWNQGAPFNNLCPVIPEKNERCVTGCVATATAQVMKYYEWPKQGTGSNYYISDGAVKDTLQADFSQSVYDWDNMLDSYNDGYTPEQGYAVAKLMSDVGIAMNMGYGSSSGTDHYRTALALATNFGYNKGIEVCYREYFNYAEWNNLIKKELSEARPIVFSGSNYYDFSGHEFVIDGYNEEGLYHVNWGWGGMSDGYYNINIMRPEKQGIGGSNGGYPGSQQMNINCFPDIDGTSVPHSQIAISVDPSIDIDMIKCEIINHGLATYVGQIGYIAMIDNEIVSSYLEDVDETQSFDFEVPISMNIPLKMLDIPDDKLTSDKKCLIYPVYFDGEGYRVPLSRPSCPSYVMLGKDASGDIIIETNPQDNINIKCDSIVITRDYAGFNVKALATLTTEDDRPVFDYPIYMYIQDEQNQLVAQGQNFAFIYDAETRELEFSCKLQKDRVLVPGQTYSVSLWYYTQGFAKLIPGSVTTVTIKDPGPAPALSYSDFTVSKTVIDTSEEVVLSFNVTNTGGFTVAAYYVYMYKDGSEDSMEQLPSDEIDLPTGTKTIEAATIVKYGKGEYHFMIFTFNGEWETINTEPLRFTIKDSGTGISNVNEDSDAADCYYDLQGRRVSSPTKGLFIKNGKKMLK